MNSAHIYEEQRKQAYEFVANVFAMTGDESGKAGTSLPPGYEFSAAMPRKNQPEFWADAPWRIEPDCDHIPMLFVVRDGDIQSNGKGPWRLNMLKVEQRLADESWHGVCAFVPDDLPNVDAQGNVTLNFWTFSVEVPLFESESRCKFALDEVKRGGDPVHLRVMFIGSFDPYDEIEAPEVHLKVCLAQHALPQGRAAHKSGPRHWFYGDTHYHSAYTNDVKEFGGPIPDTRDAGLAIGLDWLVVTDHSCDLDEEDDDPAGRTRWERLKAELSSPDISDDQFRYILGEEVTLRGGEGERYVHMLAFGAMEELIQGGFLPDQEGGFLTKIYKETIEELLDKVLKDGGYHPNTAKRLFGPVHTLAEVLDALPEDALAFAAHPYTFAQPPFVNCDWAEEDLAHPRLTGHEFWNGRSRRNALLTDNPFSRPGWTDSRRLKKNDASRLNKLQEHVERNWDSALQRGVDEWLPSDDLPAQRPVFIAGSDAHGSFNYSVGWGWNYQTQFQCSDNALGKVRTAIHLPDHGTHTVPEVDDILAVMKKGSCVVTDGPLIDFSLGHNGDTAYMGDVLTVTGDGEVEMRIVVHTTPEFGDVEKVEVVTYFQGQAGGASTGTGWLEGFLDRAVAFFSSLWDKGPRKMRVRAGKSNTVKLAGSRGLCRVQAQTVGRDGERFCCYTNPIWVRVTDGQKARMRVQFAP